MNRNDRAVARAYRHLTPDETLLASTVGYEHDGRRRRVVLLTDRRLVVTGLRNEPAVELTPADTSASYEPAGSRLHLDEQGITQLILREVEPAAAHQIVALLEDRRTLPKTATMPRVQHVHIQTEQPDHNDH